MTLNNDCEKLDAYLDDDLSNDDVAHFETHLEECAACREAIDEQQWIDNLLHSPTRIQLERPPAMILHSFRSSLAKRRRRVLQAACGLAAAAVLLIAVSWLGQNRRAVRQAIPDENGVAEIAVPAPLPLKPQATFVATSDAIAVPLESSSDDVSIIQVYPTTEAERRWRLELTLTSLSTKPNGG